MGKACACEKVLTGGAINGGHKLKVKDKINENLNLRNRLNYLQSFSMFVGIKLAPALSLLANASINGCSLYQTPLCEGRPAPSLRRPLWIKGALFATFQSECTFLSSGGDRQARLPSLPALVLRRPKRDHSSVRGARPPGGP